MSDSSSPDQVEAVQPPKARPDKLRTTSTLNAPPRPQAIKAFHAMIRKDLREARG